MSVSHLAYVGVGLALIGIEVYLVVLIAFGMMFPRSVARSVIWRFGDWIGKRVGLWEWLDK